MRLPPLHQILRQPIPGVQIVDVGAMIEGEDRYADLVAQGLARVVGFEPNPVELARLRQRAAPHCEYLPYFLGRGGPATFHQTTHPGCSSLYAPDLAVTDLFAHIGLGAFHVRETHPVETHRLDDIAECPAPDYLKLDVQAAEHDVLEGAARTLASVLVIEAEVEFVPLYQQQPLFGDLQVLLRTHGFVLHKFVDVAGRAFRPFVHGDNPRRPMSQLLWADAIFIRDFWALDRLTPDQLLKAALILHNVYLSYDLVHHLLRAHDARCGTTYAGAYLQAIAAAPQLTTLFMNLRLDD
jgi:FkbM family methyltransferase